MPRMPGVIVLSGQGVCPRVSGRRRVAWNRHRLRHQEKVVATLVSKCETVPVDAVERQWWKRRVRHKHRVQLENSRALQTWNRGSWV